MDSSLGIVELWRWDWVFRPQPTQWGLRGDPFAWQVIEAEVTARGVPGTSGQAVSWLRDAFRQAVGVDVDDDSGGREYVWVSRFDHAGTSRGHVDLSTWRERLMPLLCNRAMDLFTENPVARQQEYEAFESLARPFAVAFSAKRTLLGDAVKLSSPQRSRVLESMSDDLRKLSDVIIGELRPAEVSEKAKIEAGEIDIDIPFDLHVQTWHTQPNFDPGRTKFMFEHLTPVNALREACTAVDDLDAVIGHLWRHMRCAWILKSENVRLSELGYGNRRPKPLAAYAEAGIQLT